MADNDLGELRLRHNELYVVVTPVEDGGWQIKVTDVLGFEVGIEGKQDGLRHLLKSLSVLRRHVYKLLGGEV